MRASGAGRKAKSTLSEHLATWGAGLGLAPMVLPMEFCGILTSLSVVGYLDILDCNPSKILRELDLWPTSLQATAGWQTLTELFPGKVVGEGAMESRIGARGLSVSLPEAHPLWVSPTPAGPLWQADHCYLSVE